MRRGQRAVLLSFHCVKIPDVGSLHPTTGPSAEPNHLAPWLRTSKLHNSEQYGSVLYQPLDVWYVCMAAPTKMGSKNGKSKTKPGVRLIYRMRGMEALLGLGLSSSQCKREIYHDLVISIHQIEGDAF